MDPRLEIVGRRKPASGVLISGDQPTIVFVTVCTKDRVGWLVEAGVKEGLVEAWTEADGWVVGNYLLMPDHVHFFCAPRRMEFRLDGWMSYWKRLFSQAMKKEEWQWQAGHWDTRLRRSEDYQEKWNYVRENPMRKGLVARAEDWPHQGMMNVLRW
jgi:putative transposase